MNELIKKALSIGFGCFLALVILEIFFRCYDPFGFRVKGNQIILPANQCYRLTNSVQPKLSSQILHTKNTIGFRGPEYPDNPEEFLKIIAVGGSTTECFYLNDGQDWPSVMGKKLEEQMPSAVWVNNAGLDGHSSFGHQILLKDYLIKFQPEIILFYMGINDAGRAELSKYDKIRLQTIDQGPNFLRTWLRNIKILDNGLNLYRLYLSQKLKLKHQTIDLALADTLTLPQSTIDKELSHHSETFIPAYRARILDLVNTCKTNGITPVFITQPAWYGGNIDKATGTNLRKIKMREGSNGELWWQILQLYNEQLISLGISENFLTIDVANQLEKKSEYFYDYLHNTNEGAERIAQIVAQELIDAHLVHRSICQNE